MICTCTCIYSLDTGKYRRNPVIHQGHDPSRGHAVPSSDFRPNRCDRRMNWNKAKVNESGFVALLTSLVPVCSVHYADCRLQRSYGTVFVWLPSCGFGSMDANTNVNLSICQLVNLSTCQSVNLSNQIDGIHGTRNSMIWRHDWFAIGRCTEHVGDNRENDLVYCNC
ncbi:hypothetical protein BDV19DRAFT_9940 [Aspergillus venezuelensis]